MKDIEIVLENLNSQGIKLDPAQTLFLKKFINLDASFKAPSFFSKDQSIGNLYLWGPVGRGKTLLLQAISDSYFPDAGRFHFIEFMQLIHSKLSQFSGTRDPLLKVVKTLARDFKLIFIDEFQIEDIADAMIIGTLIQSLSENGVRLMLSSNAKPLDLYKDGLQRKKFLKTSEFIDRNFEIFHLLGAEDYRLKEIAQFDSSSMEGNHNFLVQDFLEKTFEKDITHQSSFLVNEREFQCLGRSEKFLWLSFDNFFSLPCGSKDFIEIVKRFEWVFINNFHECNDDHLDKIRRFISFIDITYQEKQKIKFFYDPDLMQGLYQGEQLLPLWTRTASRLHQIATKKYLQNLEKK